MSERSETESERDLDNIEVLSEPDAVSSKRSSLRSGAGVDQDRNASSPPPHQVRHEMPSVNGLINLIFTQLSWNAKFRLHNTDKRLQSATIVSKAEEREKAGADYNVLLLCSH